MVYLRQVHQGVAHAPTDKLHIYTFELKGPDELVDDRVLEQAVAARIDVSRHESPCRERVHADMAFLDHDKGR